LRRIETPFGQLQSLGVPRDGRFLFSHLEGYGGITLLKYQFRFRVVERNFRGKSAAIVLPCRGAAAEQIRDIADIEIQVGAVFRILSGPVQQPGATIKLHRPFQASPLFIQRFHDFGNIPPGLGRIFGPRYPLPGPGDPVIGRNQMFPARQIGFRKTGGVQQCGIIRITGQQLVVKHQQLPGLSLRRNRLDVTAMGLKAAAVISDQIEKERAGCCYLAISEQALSGGQGLADIGGPGQVVKWRFFGQNSHLLFIKGRCFRVTFFPVENFG